MGRTRLERYADRFLTVIVDHMPRKKEEGKFAEYKQKIVEKGYRQAYAPWTDGEEAQLVPEHESGMKLSRIAKAHSRTTGAVRSRLKKLSLEEED